MATSCRSPGRSCDLEKGTHAGERQPERGYRSGGRLRYSAESRERHVSSVITAHAVHAAPRRG